MKQEICIGCDHAGFKLKEQIKNFLKQQNYIVKDFGSFSEESVDYPDIIHPLASEINRKISDMGIVICGSGNGVSIVANKYPNVRCALCWNTEIAALARKHNDANVISLPARFISDEEALQIVKVFLTTDFEGGRHLRRVEKINKLKE